ncbi:MAG: hypothetical protein DCC75_11780 [Proteobacteria bacterium]|nr:MAG: hypothetical protein DCC75_11780 [Pseudomonadota bacterium]
MGTEGREEIKLEGGGNSEIGAIQVYQRTRSEVLLRTLGTGALLIGLAVISIFIPIAHFILVPLFLILALIMIPIAARSSQTILAGEGKCPYCQAHFRLFKRRYAFPISDICEGCSRTVTLDLRR